MIGLSALLFIKDAIIVIKQYKPNINNDIASSGAHIMIIARIIIGIPLPINMFSKIPSATHTIIIVVPISMVVTSLIVLCKSRLL